MAFQNLINGAECSTGANSVAQMLKQFGEDRTIQQDRFLPDTTRESISGFRTRGPVTTLPENQFADEFFDERIDGSHANPATVQSSDLIHKEQHSEFAGPEMRGWVTEFADPHTHPQSWAPNGETEMMEKAFSDMHIQDRWKTQFFEAPQPSNTQPIEIPEFDIAFQKNFGWADEFALRQQEKGKGNVESDVAYWEKRFAAVDNAEINQQSHEINDNLSPENKIFESVWDNMKDLTESDLSDLNQQDWERDFTRFGDYSFEPNNPYMDLQDPLQEGKRLIEEGGSLSEAALAFEAAVQKNENSPEAWTLLGNTQAQNEKEEPAIKALQRAIAIDGNNLDALMSLAISYTNENYDHQSYLTLERWMAVKYPAIVVSSAPMDTVRDTHSRVTDLYLQAARSAPEGQEMDPDVQVGLGVLFYGSDNFDKAIDCFVSALKSRPKDYLLWNRLGATLANSGRSEDAIEAYHKALDLKPTFVRARYNLGVSCINIGCYKEAAEHLLGALSMHQTGHESGREVNVSTSLIETLRRTFAVMDRKDLVERATAGIDVNEFREEFDF